MIIVVLHGPDVWDEIQVWTAHDRKAAEEGSVEMVQKFVEPMRRYKWLDYQLIKQLEHVDSFLLDLYEPGLDQVWKRL